MSSRPSRGAARLAAILDALPDALLLVNCNGTVVNANTIALETFESPGTALVGRGLLDLLPSFDSKRIPGSMRRPDDDEGRTKPTRMVARRTDGSEFPVEVTSANLEDGRTPYADLSLHHYTGDELLMLVVRDLSGTVDTEAELARQQRQTEMILRAAAEGVVGVDTDGKVVLVNPSAAQILGYRASDLGGKELHPLIHHSRPDGTPLPYNESPLADSLRSGRKHRVRGQVLWAKDGRAVPVDLTTAPVRDGDQLVGAVMTFTDRRKYDAVAARHAQLLAVLDEALRGPLDQLRSELGTLAADPAGQLWPEANQILHYLTAGYARMTTLIDNVLSYQRLDSGRDRLDREPVSLDGVVAAGVEGAIELIGPGRAQFAVHAPPIEAEVDAKRLAQALAHLIADVAGVDATGKAPVGGVAGDSTIVVAAAQRGEVVRIEVRGPYAGGDPVHEPIVRGIVERHGGVLQTHEVPGTNGSSYVLEVPLAAGGGTAGERPPADVQDRDNATTVMPVPRERARGTAEAPDAAQDGGDSGVDPDAGASTDSGPRAGAGVDAGNSFGGAAGQVPAQSTGSQSLADAAAAAPGPVVDPRDPEADSGGQGSAQGGSLPDLSAVESQVPETWNSAAQSSNGAAAQASGSAQVPADPKPTGRRRGRPSPAESEGQEAAARSAGPRTGRRARHGGGGQDQSYGSQDQSYGSLATAADERPEQDADGSGRAAQNGSYVAGANGVVAVPAQGTGSEPQASALPALPGAPADNGQQTGWANPGNQGQGPGQQGLSPVPSQLRPAALNGSGTPVPPQGTGPERQGAPAEPTGRRARRAGASAQATPAEPQSSAVALPPGGGAAPGPTAPGDDVPGPGPGPYDDLAAGQPYAQDSGSAEPTGRRGRRVAPPSQGTPPALAGPEPQQQPQPYGPEGDDQAQPPAGGRPAGRRARRALADGGLDRAVPGPGPESGEEQAAGGGTGGSRRAFALPPAEADQKAGAAGAGQPGAWDADAQGRHDLAPSAVDADHTPPRAHPVPTGRRRARRDPAEEQQAQNMAGGPGQSTPAQSTPAQDAPPQGVPAPATPPQAIPAQGGPSQGVPAQDAASPGTPPQGTGMPGALPEPVDPAGPAAPVPPQQAAPQPRTAAQPEPQSPPYGTRAAQPLPPAQPLPAEAPAPAQQPQPQPQQQPSAAAPEGPVAGQSRAISVRTLGQGVPFAQQVADQQRPQMPQPPTGSGRRRKLAAPPQEEGERTPAGALEPAARPREPQLPQQPQQPQQPPRLLDTQEGRAYAIGAPDEGSEGPEPLDGPNGAVDVTDSQAAPPMDDELPPEPLDNPRRLLVWPAPDVSTQQALSDRGYRPVIVHSREEVDAQIAAYPAALFVDPLTGPITRTALQSLRTAAVAAEVPVLVTAGLGQATREAAYGADPAVLLKALAPRDSEQHPPRVLLIETHDAIAGALAATLERRGMQVARAASDADAVTLAAQMRPNLVVMDLMQVRRRRAGIVDWLRANGLLNRTPLVVYTSADMDPAELPRLTSGETVLFLAERSTSPDVQNRIVDLLAKIGAN
ncbi:PAS domain-containing protein [Streptomyces sp. 7N604]|uniref:PAS domain-containing protein n=1 Tax=Streptomyces sp. 7N604 TaxID=3457415 RepID=UPI003FD460BB